MVMLCTPVAREGAVVAGDAAVLRGELLDSGPHAAREVPAPLRPPELRALCGRLQGRSSLALSAFNSHGTSQL